MYTIYFLSTCNTCKKMLKELDLSDKFSRQDLKKEPLSREQLEKLRKLSGSYESLFNRRSQRYRRYNLKDKSLSEKDYKHYILEHYTFLKRPVIVMGDQIFIGSSKKTRENLNKALATENTSVDDIL